MLAGQAKNLARIDFPQLDRLREKLGEIDRLMGQAQGIDFRVDQLDERYRQLFPDSFAAAMTRDEQIAAAKQRLDTEMDAFRKTKKEQSGNVENVRVDGAVLSDNVAKSKGAEGTLAATQATNHLPAPPHQRPDAHQRQ